MYRIGNKRIALYGDIEFDSRTAKIKSTLERCGLCVDYIIDKRYLHLKTDSKRVAFEEFKRASLCKGNDWVIVLCFYSVSTHTAVADELHNDGFSQIVFLPEYGDADINLAHVMRIFFTHMLYGDLLIDSLLPNYLEIRNTVSRVDCIIAEYGEGEYFSTYISISMLYIGIEKHNVFGPVTDGYLRSVQDKHISTYESHNELFRYIFGGGAWPECYAKHFSFGRDPQKVVFERKSIYLWMMQMSFDDPDFWKDAPIPVVWNPKGHFNILDGHHRASFLYNAGAKRVPVIMTKNDFNAYREFMATR